MKYFCEECEKKILKNKREVLSCSKCGKVICPKDCYQYVDESNVAITKSAKLFCKNCFKDKI